MTPDGTLTEVNRAPLESAGIPADAVIGKKFWDCHWWSHSPESAGEIARRLRACRRR